MKLKVTQKGVFDPENKEVDVGHIIEIDGDDIPSFLVGKVVEVEGGKPMPASGAERQQLLSEAATQIGDDDFLKDGRPDVRALNEILDEAEGDFEPFTSEERDRLWPAVKDAVIAERG